MGARAVSLDALLPFLEHAIAQFPDSRTGDNTRYTMRDIGLGAFSVFFSQSPSFLSHQRSMQMSKGSSNARTVFGLTDIPTDAWIREMLDPVSRDSVAPVFRRVFRQLDELGVIDTYRMFDGNLLVALDGTWFHSSEQVHCEHCSVQHHKDGTTRYFHNAITPVVVQPQNNCVLSLEPEFITPQDGEKKQDCENAAAKRWLTGAGLSYAAKGVTILGDDLYCNDPMCRVFLYHSYHFLLTCKYSSHKYLAEWIEIADPKEDLHEQIIKKWDGKKHVYHRYRFANDVPIKEGANALRVNWLELTIFDTDRNEKARHAFATDHHLTAENVASYIDAGRARWKIENEHNNTLKTKGYNLEHNFGHGKENLSNLLLSLNLLAFLFHTVLEILEPRYRLIRQTLPRRDRFFNDVKALLQYMLFDSWDALMLFMLEGLDLEDPGG
jgi:hypothetical protein